MRYPFFASFIILVLVIRHAIRRNRHLGEKQEQSFWERERLANETRRKPLDDLEYVHIDLNTLPTDTLPEDEIIADCITTLRGISTEKIVNLTGLTNTDLKLKYGAANLPALTEYDGRYLVLIQNLEKWAARLWEFGYTEESVCISQYMVSIRADVGAVYRRLSSYYKKTGQTARIEELITVADTLQTASRPSILRYLQEAIQS